MVVEWGEKSTKYGGFFWDLPGLVKVYKKRTGKIHHAINGKIHYVYGHFQ